MPREHQVVLRTTTENNVSFKATGFKAGLSRSKGWFMKVLMRVQPSFIRDNKFAIRKQVWKRKGFGNLYSEMVTMRDTKELIHSREEPLTEHTKKKTTLSL